MIASTVASAIQGAERRLVDALALRSRTLQPHLAHATGLWKDSPITITSRTYEGDAVGVLRVALIAGAQLEIGSLLVLARPNRGLPILAAELLWRGSTRETSVSATILPTRDDATSLPGALDLRASPEQVPDAIAALDRMLDGWITMGGAKIPFPDAADVVRRRQREYLVTNRARPETLSLLAAMFGRAWAGEYVEKVLFPAG